MRRRRCSGSRSGESVKLFVVKRDPTLSEDDLARLCSETSPPTSDRSPSSFATSFPRPMSARYFGANSGRISDYQSCSWVIQKGEKPDHKCDRAFLFNSLTMSYFHTGIRTIIGAEAFHCPVRDGKEWDHLAMVIRLNLLPS